MHSVQSQDVLQAIVHADYIGFHLHFLDYYQPPVLLDYQSVIPALYRPDHRTAPGYGRKAVARSFTGKASLSESVKETYRQCR